MTNTTNFATGTTQGAAVAHTYQVGAIVSTTTSDVTPGFIISTLPDRKVAIKEQSWKKLLPLSRTLHLIINLANDFKQKVSLATNGCWIRKGQLRFVSEMWSSTLKVAFLFNNLVK